MDYRDYPYSDDPNSFPNQTEEQNFDERTFPGGGFGPPGPPGFPGFPPGQPGGGQQAGGPPTSPPPSFTPQQQVTTFAVDPGGIRGCLFRFTYIWLRNGRSFWFFPTFVGRNSVSGWRWRNFRWVYYGTDLRRISSFQCF